MSASNQQEYSTPKANIRKTIPSAPIKLKPDVSRRRPTVIKLNFDNCSSNFTIFHQHDILNK